MPKEIINDSQSPVYQRIELGWGKGTETVGITAERDDARFEDGTRARGDRVLVSLDREGIKRLRKALRRAERQAYFR